MTFGDSELASDFWVSPTKTLSQGYCLIRQPVQSYRLQLLFGLLFTWPADQPRHATYTSGYPVDTSSPPVCKTALLYNDKSKRTALLLLRFHLAMVRSEESRVSEIKSRIHPVPIGQENPRLDCIR